MCEKHVEVSGLYSCVSEFNTGISNSLVQLESCYVLTPMNEWQAAITCKAYTFLRVELMPWTSPILTACTVYFHSISLYAGQ